MPDTCLKPLPGTLKEAAWADSDLTFDSSSYSRLRECSQSIKTSLILMEAGERKAGKFIYTEMEFLDIYLLKDLSLLLRAVHSLFYWRILKKNILFSGLKKIRDIRKLESIHE
jgi:hypothetical protein